MPRRRVVGEGGLACAVAVPVDAWRVAARLAMQWRCSAGRARLGRGRREDPGLLQRLERPDSHTRRHRLQGQRGFDGLE